MTFLEQLQESAGLLGNQIQNVNPGDKKLIITS